MVAHVDAKIDAAIPLPSHVSHRLPNKVLVDDAPAVGLFRKDNGLWGLVPAGNHTVALNGPLPRQNTVQLPFPLKPRRLTIDKNGWVVEGVHPDGSFDSQIQFKRIVEQESEQAEILETGILPPFALVERNILLGLEWKVETKVQRMSPPGSALVLNIPLLSGESVTTEGVRVDHGVAQINLDADQELLTWQSFLEPSGSIDLKHADTDGWTEIWKVDVSPIFHMDYDGIPVILHKTGDRWYPTWHPWPNEEVHLKITRPQGIDGQTMTVERSHIELRPGQRSTDGTLLFSVKSSQGVQHSISLPQDAVLQEVKIDEKVQPIRQQGRVVTIPVSPGTQDIELQWRESKGMMAHYRSSDIDLGMGNVNAGVDINMPLSRWPLFVGGEQLVGPEVFFWSVLIVVVLGAFGLSKTGLTPLRFHHWIFLGIGMSMSNLAACVLVVGWLIALDLRKKAAKLEGRYFQLVQLGLVVLTVLALGSFVSAISHGLLGHPDMNIAGNGSGSDPLRWYQDVSDSTLPRAWVISIPMPACRIAMLAWALWISFWLVGTLRWGWKRFTEPTIWYGSPKRPEIPPDNNASGE